MSTSPASATAPILDASAPPAEIAASEIAQSGTTFEERVAAYETNVLPDDYDFDPAFTVDENYMILALIYARLSVSKRGNMACIIVEPEEAVSASTAGDTSLAAVLDEGARPTKRARREDGATAADDPFPRYPGRILMHSNNTPEPLPDEANAKLNAQKPMKKGQTAKKEKANESAFQRFAAAAPELHAEARAICVAASTPGMSLCGPRTTAYITFPPCNACMPLLLAVGVKRLVYRQTATPIAHAQCQLARVEYVEFSDRAHDDKLKEHVKAWWTARGEGKEETRARVERWWLAAEKRLSGGLPQAISSPVDATTTAGPIVGNGSRGSDLTPPIAEAPEEGNTELSA
ncbi:hypothetical protein BMF94_3598 [Rhodotorula taiwanensis]|uniref:CMP/dCMP-type deaminase domain-containing protein n=1 Tax=Rhodotorula taiwanensis TaxID=741276 RepID=A0A2S5B910_9BASI|nr:hypothetical protein BMF94_3598 [Rhodotorula taiwanensis]